MTLFRSDIYSCKRQKFLIRLNPLSDELTVPEQSICGHRGRNILCGFLIRDVNDLKTDIVRFRGFLHSRNPVIGKGALIGIVEDESGFFHLWVSGAFLKSRRLRVGIQRQIHQGNAGIGGVCREKTLIPQREPMKGAQIA